MGKNSMMNEADAQRAQKLGSLIQEAREHNGCSPQEVAAVLGVETAVYEQIEKGESLISLPDLEALALFLKVPMGYFWGSDQLRQEKPVDYDSLMALRHRVIGVLVRQLRLQNRLSHQEVAQELGLKPAIVKEYEGGTRPVPYLHLEKLGQLFDVPITHFVEDGRGPLKRHEAQLQLLALFDQLSPEMQTFIANPTNRIYLETAKKLSDMDVNKLRELAESLIDITW
jgi:transcriptional regulator with XRE-family HTH domain